MINLKHVTLRNFLSVGSVTQAVDLNNQELTLILGDNLDLGGDGARNGTGKTTLIQAVSYALYGVPLNNIKANNLINRTNGKSMMVTLDFEANGVDYRIERGRKPHGMKFFINGTEEEDNEAQGENKETQKLIEDIMGMSSIMFRNIVALNTYSQPFLSMTQGQQRDIIEQLLGITLLSEKAEKIKVKIKANKEEIQQEEFKVQAVEEANKRIEEQIDSLRKRARLWDNKTAEDISTLKDQIRRLEELDIDAELLGHTQLSAYNALLKDHADIDKLITRTNNDVVREAKAVSKFEKELEILETNKCHTCGQDFHDDAHSQVLKDKEESLLEHTKHLTELAEVQVELEGEKNSLFEVGERPNLFYNSESEAIEHKNKIKDLKGQVSRKEVDENPYIDQISEMETNAIQEADFDKINGLSRVGDHQKFLLDLLTSKDSFVRKKIIDQNLSYLNSRLTSYLDKMGLPHQVVFQNDLSVEITELGRELDFDNLSRGERNRLILGLSFAFRDVWENLYFPINTLFIDELIDSGLDTIGVESAMAILKDMTRNRNKSVWLVSHREELAGRVASVLQVIKENGFTTYNSTRDMENL
jgi:DNA repair exonuclease SbcCD ATPase subunit|tara:strand:+ start:1326 stop:3092 length:1767 start_codon:yes stop_codon:yes gene_type:complete